MLRPLIN